MGRPAPQGAPPEGGGDRRAGRQVHRPARRLSLRRRGAQGRRLRPRVRRPHPLGAGRRVRRHRRGPPHTCTTSTPCCVPGGFGVRGLDGKIGALNYARTNGIPTLGLCLGLQCMVIEYARNVAGLEKADSTEFDPDCPEPVIATMEEQKSYVEGAGDLGGTMRLGLYPADLVAGLDRPPGVRRRQDRGAPPTPVRGQQPLPRPARRGRPGLLRHQPRPRAGRVRRAAARGAPLLRLDPGAPRAAFPPDQAAPAVRRADRRGDRAAEGRAVPDRRVQAPARARGRPLAGVRLSQARAEDAAVPDRVSAERDDHGLPALGRARRGRRARDLRPAGGRAHARWPSWPSATSSHEDTLHRLLRALATVGVYDEQDGRWSVTELGEGLRSDVPGTLRPLARTLSSPALWAAYGHLGHSVRTGENAFEARHGVDVWTHRRAHPEENAVFNDNMTALTSGVAEAVADVLRLRRHLDRRRRRRRPGHPAGGRPRAASPPDGDRLRSSARRGPGADLGRAGTPVGPRPGASSRRSRRPTPTC